MHELRSMMETGGRASLLAKRAPKRKAEEGASLAALAIPRTESRTCNQRREDRHLGVADRAELTFRRRKYDVAVVNVSPHGAMIEADLEPRIGERMTIRFEGGDRTECTVRWLRGGRVGIEFSQQTEIPASAKVEELSVSGRRAGEEPPPEQSSRAPRQSLLWKAVVHWDHGTIQVRLRNISAQGAMLECPQDFAADTDVLLDLGEGGTVPGTVRWSRSGQAGVQFSERFDLRNLARTETCAEHSPSVVKPLYLESENDPNSPWAAAWDKFTPDVFDEE